MVAAAITSSAPVGWTFNSWKYWTNVGWQLANTTMGGSQACYQSVYDSYQQVDSLIRSGNYTQLKSDFDFCEPSLDLSDSRNQFSVGIGLSGAFGNLAYINQMAANVSYRDICPLFTDKSRNSYGSLKIFISMAQKG